METDTGSASQNTPHLVGVRLYGDEAGYCVTAEGKVVRRIKSTKGLVDRQISDCYARIVEELRRHNGTSMYLVEGYSAKSGHKFQFHIDAADFADPRTLARELATRFGAQDITDKLEDNVIRQISCDIKKLQLVEVPSWLDAKVAVPGLDIPGVQYVLSPKCPAHVGGGNLVDGIRCYQKLIRAFDARQATVALMPVLGSPIIAKYLPEDRFCVFKHGVTGTHKTGFDMLAMGIYGPGYLKESNLHKWGDRGGTINAHMRSAAMAGMLPVPYDNYKPLKYKDAPNLVSFIHAVCEGSDKERLTATSDFQESLQFSCIPIINGEDFVDDPATLARCVSFEWKSCNTDLLTEAQALQENLPAVGKEWLLWLQENPDKVKAAVAGFEGIRQEYIETIKSSNNNINVGRVASNLAVIRVIWDIALQCPVTKGIFRGHEKDFDAGIAELLTSTPTSIAETNEAEMFVASLRELISSGRARVINADGGIWREEIGHSSAPEVGWIADGELCIYPDIARKLVNEIAPTTQHISKRTLYKQLDEHEYIKTESEGKQCQRTLKRTHPIRGQKSRVLVFHAVRVLEDDTST